MFRLLTANLEKLRKHKALGEPVAPRAGTPRGRRHWRWLLAAAWALLLTFLWLGTPLSKWTEPQQLALWVEQARASPLGPLWAGGSFLVGTWLLVPMAPMLVALSLFFDPLTSIGVAGSACLASALLAHAIGRGLFADGVPGPLGSTMARFGRLSPWQSILAIIVLRNVPGPPYVVGNVAVGASGMALLPFLVGNSVGLMPGIFFLCLASEQLIAAIRQPSWGSIAVGICAALALLALGALCRKLLQRPGTHAD